MNKHFFALLIFFVFPFFSWAQYCANRVDSPCQFTNIRSVTCNNLNQSDATCDKDGTAGADGYSDYTNLVLGLRPGESTIIEVLLDGNLIDQVTIYIDWNNDGSWDPNTELVPTQGYSYVGANIAFTGVITPPDDAVEDNLIVGGMRVICANSGTIPDPCGNPQFGEIEDYSFIVSSTPVAGADYCDASGGGCAQASPRNILRVQYGTVDNSSGCAPTGYSDFTQFYSTAAPNEQITFTVTINTDFAFNHVLLWVDWNQDFSFDASEEVPMVGNVSIGGEYIGTAIVPANTAGFVRMRTRVTVNPGSALNSNSTPCGGDALGEVEDYSIFAGAPLDCISNVYPADGQMNVCLEDTTISWSSVTDATKYIFSLLKYTSTDTTTLEDEIELTDTTYTFQQILETSVEYRWVVTPINETNTALNCDTLSFTASPTPHPVLNATQTTFSHCANSSSFLEATVQDGTAPYSFQWSGDIAHLDRADTLNATFSGSNSGNYSVSLAATDDFGCASSPLSFDISVTPLPAWSSIIWGDTNLCPNEEALVQLTGAVGNVQFQSHVNNAWGNINHQLQNTDEYVLSLIPGIQLVRIVLESNGCNDTIGNQEFIVIDPVDAPEIASDDPDFTWCENESHYIYVSNYDNDLTWSTGETQDTIIPSQSGSYTVTYSFNNDECSITSSATDVIVAPVPERKTVKTDTPQPCEGESIELYLDTEHDVLWSNQLNTDTIEVTDPNQYWATITSIGGCSVQSDSIQIDFAPLPERKTVQTDTPQPCEGETTQLYLDTEDQVLWSNQLNTDTIDVSSSGLYWARIISENGCSVQSDSLQIDFSPLPDTPSISQVGTDSLMANTLANSYAWELEGQPLTQNTQTIFAELDGNYTVQAISEFGCASDFSSPYFFESVSIIEPTDKPSFELFPNPVTSNEKINIHVTEHAEITCTNISGQSVRKFSLAPGSHTLEIDFPVGVYLLQNKRSPQSIKRLVVID